MVASSLLLITSCTHKADLTGIPDVCFEGEVLPIFKTSCAIPGCHDGTGEDAGSLDSYTAIMRGIKPGSLSGSSIYNAITSTVGNKMPPDQPLSADNRALIRLWIQQGAKQTTCPGI